MDIINFEIVHKQEKVKLNSYFEKNIEDKKEIQIYEIVLKVNDEVHHNFEVYDLFANINKEVSEYYIKNCSCGVPECAGYDHPIVQIKNNNDLTWLITDKNLKFKKLIYKFNKEQFLSEVEKLKNFIIENEKKSIFCDRFVDDKIIYFNEIKENQSDFSKIVKSEMKNYVEKIFNIEYQGEKTDVNLNVFDILNYVARIYSYKKLSPNEIIYSKKLCRNFYKILKNKNNKEIIKFSNNRINQLLNFQLSEFYPEFQKLKFKKILVNKCKFI